MLIFGEKNREKRNKEKILKSAYSFENRGVFYTTKDISDETNLDWDLVAFLFYELKNSMPYKFKFFNKIDDANMLIKISKR